MDTIETIHTQDKQALFVPDTVTKNLAQIREEALALVPDITTDKGRKEIASVAHKVAQSKVAIDKVGAALVKPLKDQAKVIDKERKRYKDDLDALKMEVRKPLSDWEEEQARLQRESDQVFFDIERYSETIDKVSGEILQVVQLENFLKQLDVLDVGACEHDNRVDEAREKLVAAQVRLETALKNRKLLNEAALRAKEQEDAVAKPEPKPAPSAPSTTSGNLDVQRVAHNEIVAELGTIIGTSAAKEVVTAIYNGKVRRLSINYN